MFIKKLEISQAEWNKVKKIHQDALDDIKSLRKINDSLIKSRSDLDEELSKIRFEKNDLEKELERASKERDKANVDLKLVLSKLNECFTIMERYGIERSSKKITSLDLMI